MTRLGELFAVSALQPLTSRLSPKPRRTCRLIPMLRRIVGAWLSLRLIAQVEPPLTAAADI